MHVFFDFWKLETENSLLYVFSFLHKLGFENNFFFIHFGLPNKFFSFKNRKLFLKTKNKGKNSYQTYPYFCSFSHLLFVGLVFWSFLYKPGQLWVKNITKTSSLLGNQRRFYIWIENDYDGGESTVGNIYWKLLKLINKSVNQIQWYQWNEIKM